jgi:hypothetical protein
MIMLTKFAARVRGYFAGNYAENKEDEQVIINNRGDIVVAQSLPELTELVRLGDSWQISSTTGQAALTALPTTTSGISINNAEPATGKCYAIDSFGSVEEVVDATQTDVTAIMAMLNKRGSAQASAGTVETGVTSLSGKAAYGGSASVRRGATVVNDNWFPHNSFGAQMAAAAAGANWKVNEIPCRGLYLVPPSGTFSVQAVKAAAAAAAQQFFFIRWHEVQLIYKT